MIPGWMTLGGWLAAGIAWQIAAMWVLIADGAAYLAWGLLTGHFRRDFLPVTPSALGRDLAAAVRFRLAHRQGRYNAVQRLLYGLVVVAALAAVLSGLSIWKPVQLGALTWVFGGYDIARRIHFALMACIVGFLVVHVTLVALVPSTLVSMITGGRRAPDAGCKRMKHRINLADHRTRLRHLERRHLLRGGLSLGAVSLLTGCDLSTKDSFFDRLLWSMLRFNDRVQAALFDPNRLAATFTADQITGPFRFNAYYPIERARAGSRLATGGERAGRGQDPWTLDRLRALPQEIQITRHICVEGWSQIGQWSGVPLRVFLQRIGADLRARYVGFQCFDGYSSIDMASALHPQTILALDFGGLPCRQIRARRCACACRQNWVSRIRRISLHIMSPTKTPAATGRTRDIIGSAGREPGCSAAGARVRKTTAWMQVGMAIRPRAFVCSAHGRQQAGRPDGGRPDRQHGGLSHSAPRLCADRRRHRPSRRCRAEWVRDPGAGGAAHHASRLAYL